MRGMPQGNWTRAPSPPSLGGGSIYSGAGGPTFTSGHALLLHDRKEKVKHTRIVSPYLDFKTDKPAMQTFRRMLRILDKAEFQYVVDFDGPQLGIERSRDERVFVDEVIEKLATMDDMDIPSFLGIRATLQYAPDEDVSVRLKVKIGEETKVKVKVRGTITKHVWNQLRADIRRKLHVKV